MNSNISLNKKANLILLIIFLLNMILWSASHHVRMPWPGVPPVPTPNGALSITLGDGQFFYRFAALTLQNVGDTGGRNQSFTNYDYNTLVKWFDLLYILDNKSNHIPMTAAYYFGATNDPKKIKVIVDYLSIVGQDEDGDKWRWLAHAVFLARYKMHDVDLALELAYKLAKMRPIGDTLPMWARHMPALVLTAMDETQAAKALLEAQLLTNKKLSRVERNFIKDYLVKRLGIKEEDIGSSLMTIQK